MTANRYGSIGLVVAVLFLTGILYAEPAAVAADVREIAITGSEFRLQPGSVTVDHGQPVVIVFRNQGVLSHNLVIDKLSLKTKTIYPGETARLSLPPLESGVYAFRCDVPGHTEAGMRGTLVVR